MQMNTGNAWSRVCACVSVMILVSCRHELAVSRSQFSRRLDGHRIRAGRFLRRSELRRAKRLYRLSNPSRRKIGCSHARRGSLHPHDARTLVFPEFAFEKSSLIESRKPSSSAAGPRHHFQTRKSRGRRTGISAPSLPMRAQSAKAKAIHILFARKRSVNGLLRYLVHPEYKFSLS
jgi:hypothetical protein